MFEYSKGIMRTPYKDFKGWIGNGDNTVETIARNISTVKDVKESNPLVKVSSKLLKSTYDFRIVQEQLYFFKKNQSLSI